MFSLILCDVEKLMLYCIFYSESDSRKPHKHKEIEPSLSTKIPSELPKEVFIVDIKLGRNGLGVGLVDGLVTALASPGIFVRSLVPDNPHLKVKILLAYSRPQLIRHTDDPTFYFRPLYLIVYYIQNERSDIFFAGSLACWINPIPLYFENISVLKLH